MRTPALACVHHSSVSTNSWAAQLSLELNDSRKREMMEFELTHQNNMILYTVYSCLQFVAHTHSRSPDGRCYHANAKRLFYNWMSFNARKLDVLLHRVCTRKYSMTTMWYTHSAHSTHTHPFTLSQQLHRTEAYRMQFGKQFNWKNNVKLHRNANGSSDVKNNNNNFDTTQLAYGRCSWSWCFSLSLSACPGIVRCENNF